MGMASWLVAYGRVGSIRGDLPRAFLIGISGGNRDGSFRALSISCFASFGVIAGGAGFAGSVGSFNSGGWSINGLVAVGAGRCILCSRMNLFASLYLVGGCHCVGLLSVRRVRVAME